MRCFLPTTTAFAVAATLSLACASPAAQPESGGDPAATAALSQPTAPVITSPKHRDNVPRPKVDPPCRPGPGCSIVNVEGTVPPGAVPFLAVAPANATPRIWIQPPVNALRRDGAFDGIVYLGSATVGAGERYSIYVFACSSKTRFSNGQVIGELPTDCQISDPVTVSRSQ